MIERLTPVIDQNRNFAATETIRKFGLTILPKLNSCQNRNQKISQCTDLDVQAALVIRGLRIRGYDYTRTQKPRIARENCYFYLKIA